MIRKVELKESILFFGGLTFVTITGIWFFRDPGFESIKEFLAFIISLTTNYYLNNKNVEFENLEKKSKYDLEQIAIKNGVHVDKLSKAELIKEIKNSTPSSKSIKTSRITKIIWFLISLISIPIFIKTFPKKIDINTIEFSKGMLSPKIEIEKLDDQNFKYSYKIKNLGDRTAYNVLFSSIGPNLPFHYEGETILERTLYSGDYTDYTPLLLDAVKFDSFASNFYLWISYKVKIEDKFEEFSCICKKTMSDKELRSGEHTFDIINCEDKFITPDTLARIVLDNLISINKHNTKNLNTSGVAKMMLKDYDNAISDLTSAIQLSPSYAPAYNNRARAYYEKGDYTRSIDDYTQAIKLTHNNGMLFYSRGVVFKKSGNRIAALKDFGRALEFSFDSVRVYWVMGLLELELGNSVNAIDDFSRAIELSPNNPDLRYTRGQLYFKLDSFAKSLADLNIAITLDPNKAEYYATRGDAWVKQSQFEKAINDYNNAIALNPSNNDLFLSRGISYHLAKNQKKALDDFNRVLSLEDKNVIALNNRALALIETGNIDKALIDLKKALDIKPSHSYSNNNIGYVYLKKNELSLAYRHLINAIEIDSSNSWAFRNLACYYSMAGENQKALNNLREAIKLGYEDADWLLQESTLENIKKEVEFKKIISKLKNNN